MCGGINLPVVYAHDGKPWRFAECHFANGISPNINSPIHCHFAERHFTQCHSAEFQFADWGSWKQSELVLPFGELTFGEMTFGESSEHLITSVALLSAAESYQWPSAIARLTYVQEGILVTDKLIFNEINQSDLIPMNIHRIILFI